MRHTHFEIRNFKGIENVRIDLNETSNDIYTLVGLNESGKTTILEGINQLAYGEDLEPLGVTGFAGQDIYSLIPISQRANFNGTIEIDAGFECNDDDEKAIARHAKSKLGIRLTQPIGRFSITRQYKFKNSQLVEDTSILWEVDIVGKKKNQRKARSIETETDEESWNLITDKIITLLPSVLYFPNFLFDLPDRIYLEEPPSDPKVHEFFRSVLQDVLDAIDPEIRLDSHITARAKSDAEHDKKNLESTLLKMEANISQTVFSNWDRIFRRKSGGKQIVVHVEKDERNMVYARLRLKDGSDLFEINERSLGFRWFFTYLLLTHYRGFRGEASPNLLFLLDEPASNLHSSAQAQLLSSFENLPSGCGVIYTTHSHHMINPLWLEGTYVVKNEGLDYDDPQNDFDARQTKISLTRYREFAAKHPNQKTYFQPILDVLEFTPSKLENVPNVVMLEGKNDFYTLTFMLNLLEPAVDINLMPGGGSGSLDDAIRLYIAWGRTFLVLLDSDKSGEKEKARYLKKFGPVVDNRILVLSDIDTSWAGKEMEDLFVGADRDIIQQGAYPESKTYNKTHFNRAIQELYLSKRKPNLSRETEKSFERLITHLRELL